MEKALGENNDSLDAGRLKQYKNLAKHEDMRRRRTECSVELRKQKRDDLMMKRRNLVEEEEELEGFTDGEAVPVAPATPRMTFDEVVAVLSNSPTIEQTRDAFECIRRALSKNKNPPVDEVIKRGLLHALVQALSIEDDKVRFEAAWGITNVVSGTSEQTFAAVEAGATAPLIKLSLHSDPQLAEQALWALANIAGDSAQLRDFIIQSDGVEALMALTARLHELSDTFARTLAWAFSNMCRHKNPHAPLGVLHVLSRGLAVLIQHPDKTVKQDSCWAISYLTDGPDDQIALAKDSGVLPTVVSMLVEGDTLVPPALRVLGNLATGNDALTQTVIDVGTLSVLPEVAQRAKGTTVIKECCWLISNVIAGAPMSVYDPSTSSSWTSWTCEYRSRLRRTQQQIQAVLDAGLMKMIVHVLETGDYKCQFECSWALANLVQGGTYAQLLELYGEQPIPALCHTLAHTNVDMLTNCMEVMYALLNTVYNHKPDELDALKEQIEEEGGLDALEKLQENENEKVYNLSYKIISEFFSEEEEEGEQEDVPRENHYNF